MTDLEMAKKQFQIQKSICPEIELFQILNVRYLDIHCIGEFQKNTNFQKLTYNPWKYLSRFQPTAKLVVNSIKQDWLRPVSKEAA